MNKIGIKIIFFYLFLFFLASCVTSKNTTPKLDSNSIVPKVAVLENFIPKLEIATPATKWADSIYSKMTFDEKVGQLFMIAAYSNRDSVHFNNVDKRILENKVGGLIFFRGGPVRQANLTNRYQAKSKIPLFIGNDAEWGLSMRLDSTPRYPWNMTLGAIQDLKLIEKMGSQMGEQCKRLGIQFNFAPVLDINTNPRNPIIGFRSFGEDKFKVTERASALMKGIQSQGVFATGKHFPGHGDSETDSHKSLPTINFSQERLNDIEFYPYKKLFQEGLSSVMVAHLNVPSLETRPNFPSSVSYNVVTTILQKQLGFNGLIFTDALNMKAASKFKKPGELDLDAFLAGNDILLFPENVPQAYENICVAYQDSILSEDRLAFSVKKILKYKYNAGLNLHKSIDTKKLFQDLNAPKNKALQYELYENAVTVLKNTESILPIKNLEKQKIAYVKLGEDNNESFLSTLKKYTEVTEIADENLDSLQVKLKLYNLVIIGAHKTEDPWKPSEFKESELVKLDFLAKNNNVILDVFARPYALLPITNFENIKGMVVSYQNNEIAQEVSAELLFGAIESKGKLPVSINSNFKVNDGLTTEKLNVLGFTAPENVGMNSVTLDKIEALAQKTITNKMAPGVQVLVARKGKVIYQKSFGYQTYEPVVKVNNSTIYDVASMTKILATLPNVMQQYDQKKISLETTLGTMLPVFANSDKKDIHFKQLLSHYAGLVAWIPFYKSTLDSAKIPSPKYYSKIDTAPFSKKVADSLFIRNDYHDTIMKKIIDSKLSLKKEYKYSDFTFMILRDYLEKETGKRLDFLVQDQFYQSLGMNNSTFNPLEKINKSTIAPSENDTYFRHQILQGYVHDMAAAMEGGVAGHAGLFSNAMDVAKMMQLYLQKGNYGGKEYFTSKTFDDFNTCHYCIEGNRRGLGFDKPQLAGQQGSTCGCVSMSSFGHTGFTGTMTWVDPETEIVYVFLSNRTFPDATVNYLAKGNIREDIQKVIQEAIVK
jgi:beta-glucosidase-like glycosyl hydrolase/CubicO group peptidase (beta-lactamase class C family)